MGMRFEIGPAVLTARSWGGDLLVEVGWAGREFVYRAVKRRRSETSGLANG